MSTLWPEELDQISPGKGEVIRAIICRHEEMRELHWFKLPDHKEQQFYRTVVSYSAFKRREGKRMLEHSQRRRTDKNLPRLEGYVLFNAIYENDLVVQMEVKHGVYNALPVKVHASLWDFYTAIGYDYKKQSYVKESK